MLYSVLFLALISLAVALPEGRIVGGNIVDISRHPHQISLRFRPNSSVPFRHYCGGSIYSKDIIITAAHCVEKLLPSQLMVVAGTNYRTGSDGVLVPVENIIMHEHYNDPEVLSNDIALLILAASLPINNFTIKPIELAENRPSAGAIAITTGYGVTKKGKSSMLLREVQVPIITNSECRQSYQKDPITEDMICAGYRGVGGRDTCQGDSGGPFVVNGKLAGIVSWGHGCGLKDYPGIYASIADLMDWITEKIAAYQ